MFAGEPGRRVPPGPLRAHRGRFPRFLVLSVSALALASCRQSIDMYNQPRVKPYRASAFFEDGSSARPPVAGTVARGFLNEDAAFYRGMGPDGKFVAESPVPITRALVLRGRERFDIYCSPCHGRTGEGDGMVVRRGFKRPPSLHVDRLRAERAGYFFDVVTNGFGEMNGYAAQVPPGDRWAIAAYVRALQLSRHAPAALLADADRKELAGK